MGACTHIAQVDSGSGTDPWVGGLLRLGVTSATTLSRSSRRFTASSFTTRLAALILCLHSMSSSLSSLQAMLPAWLEEGRPASVSTSAEAETSAPSGGGVLRPDRFMIWNSSRNSLFCSIVSVGSDMIWCRKVAFSSWFSDPRLKSIRIERFNSSDASVLFIVSCFSLLFCSAVSSRRKRLSSGPLSSRNRESARISFRRDSCWGLVSCFTPYICRRWPFSNSESSSSPRISSAAAALCSGRPEVALRRYSISTVVAGIPSRDSSPAFRSGLSTPLCRMSCLKRSLSLFRTKSHKLPSSKNSRRSSKAMSCPKISATRASFSGVGRSSSVSSRSAKMSALR
eukprot:RCo011969